MRYSRNASTITNEEQLILKDSKVCVVGCGGLGGHIIEMLTRLGVGTITAIDGDVFEISNLNRQILSTSQTIGKSKALAAKERMILVNPEITINEQHVFLNEGNARSLLEGHDVVVDALDHIKTRFILQDTCEKLIIPMVHGAVAGWYGQVTTIYPGDGSLDKLYKSKQEVGKEKVLGCPAFIPNLISAMEVAEVIKILLNKGEVLRHKVMFVNLLEQEYEVVNL